MAGLDIYRNRFLILLLSLFGVFLILYLKEPVFNGLWESLLSTIIAVLLIERIVQASEKQKNEKASIVVNQIIWHAILRFISQVLPPEDWKERLRNSYDVANWKDYYQRIDSIRNETITRVDDILASYGHLIDSERAGDLLSFRSYISSIDLEFWKQGEEGFYTDLLKLSGSIAKATINAGVVMEVRDLSSDTDGNKTKKAKLTRALKTYASSARILNEIDTANNDAKNFEKAVEEATWGRKEL